MIGFPNVTGWLLLNSSHPDNCPGNIHWIYQMLHAGLSWWRLGPASLAVASEVEVLEDWLLDNKLLCNKGCDGNHSQTAVVEFLGLKVILGLGVGWVQVEGVKAEGAWLVVCVQLVEVA